jgi:hypothetical protein
VCILYFPAKKDSLSLVTVQRLSIIQKRHRTQDKLLQSGLLLLQLQFTCTECSTTLNMPTIAASDTSHMAPSISRSTGTRHMSGVHRYPKECSSHHKILGAKKIHKASFTVRTHKY